MMQSVLDDLRLALRLLRRRAGFSLMVIAVLALGIGATSSMFSVTTAVLFKSLPYPQADEVMVLWAPQRVIKTAPLSGPDFADWKKGATSFEFMAAVHESSLNLVEGGEPVRVPGAKVSHEYFDVLGVKPSIGRPFTAEEDGQKSRVAILSHRIHERRFETDPNIVGRSIALDGEPYTVIGVLPEAGLATPRGTADVWVPLGLDPTTGEGEFGGRGSHYLSVIGRLQDGVTVEAAQAELSGIARQLEASYPDSNDGVGAQVIPLHEQWVKGMRSGLLLLFGAIALVLLIACVNVANLLIARSSARRMELAVRVALGARRGRLIRQLLTESVVLALAGGLVGIVVSLWGVDLLKATLSDLVPASIDIALDGWSVVFAMSLSLAVGVLFGILPAVTSSKLDVFEALKDGASRGSAGRSRTRLRSALVAAEIALAFVLLAGAGILGKNFLAIQARNPGFDAASVQTGQLLLSGSRYEQPAAIPLFADTTLERLRARPEVIAAGATDFLPMTGQNTNGDFMLEGREPGAWSDEMVLERRRASPGYFETMGVRLVAGRFFAASDDVDSAPVIMVNEAFVRRVLGGEDALGRRLKWSDDGPWREIVGVVGDVHTNDVTEEVPLESYVPISQLPSTSMSFVVRASDGRVNNELIPEVVRSVDPMQPVFAAKPMEEIVDGRSASRRFRVEVLGVFATVALLLAAMGLFGVVSYQANQRTREIGIRVALGAQARTISWLILRESLQVVGLGLGIGLLIAVLLGGTLERFLHGASAIDASVYGVLAMLLGAVALVASYLPARRAARLSPAVALRDE